MGPKVKIDRLCISNFRGIRETEMSSLGNIIIIAGQNGSGKSCIFDAIRLIKSVYGGYQANEWQQWMGEFQIAISNRSSDFQSMFNDAAKELRITCDFKLAPEERLYLLTNAADVLKEYIWRLELPEAYSWGGYRMAMFASQFRDREPSVAKRALDAVPQLTSELASQTIRAERFIPVGGTPQIAGSLALAAIFSSFRPQEIGVIDYHGAQRHYGRETVQGINLSLDSNEQQRSQSALYNYAAKYSNVKGEMAGSFVKELLAERAGVPRQQQSTLSVTLSELFSTFFPEKKFLRPQPTVEGTLTFPVQTADGHVHDLDELSAGEKEILYGYLRIRNSAPRNSIIILDEPELHLNPRLIRGLPQFYKRNLVEALGNQIWLVTHSDALLREVVGREQYNVFHMLPCSTLVPSEQQLRPLNASADLDRALVDLVGDLASYRPSGKVVIFEGGGDSDFDRTVVGGLFPELQIKANLISGSNKARVRSLHETLEAAARQGNLPFQFFAVTDRDSSNELSSPSQIGLFSWDVYHIENYFLEAKYIRGVLQSLGFATPPGEDEIFEELRACALETLPQLVRHELAQFTNSELVKCIDVGTDPKKGNLASEIHGAISRSYQRIGNVVTSNLSESVLSTKESNLKTQYERNVADGSWTKTFRGRDVLRRFAGRRAGDVSYEVFRNLILSRMQDDNFQPEGMREIVDKILSA